MGKWVNDQRQTYKNDRLYKDRVRALANIKFQGTELYPRVFGLDLKRFINCRFSMTFWQLAGFSFCYQSYAMHGNQLDWGLFFSALSQYLYLVKFYFWVSVMLRRSD